MENILSFQWGCKPRPQLSEQWLNHLFYDNQQRAKHILGVVKQVDSWLKPLAYLHDVGYSSQVTHFTDFHPIDGAIYAWEHGYSFPIVMGVLYHSGAKGEAVLRGLDMSFYQETEPLLTEQANFFINAISYYDLRTSPIGEKVTLTTRLQEINQRYSSNHIVSQNIKNYQSLFYQIKKPVFLKIVDNKL